MDQYLPGLATSLLFVMINDINKKIVPDIVHTAIDNPNKDSC